FLRLLPSIRLVAVCNTLAYANSRDDSDIDFFIVTRPGTIWTTRLMTNLFTAALRVRPRAHVGRDTICLTFFTTPETLDFRSLQRHPQDLYLHYWINQLVPLADRDGTYDQFFLANNWLRSHLPYFRPYRSGHRRRVDALRRSHTVPDAQPTGAASRLIERTARVLQQRILPAHLRAMANRDTRVIVNDHMLKFHDKDRRDQYRQAFERRFRSVVAPS
ncbi:MAG: hypothetical protein HY341_00840, partial [Candidatus Kerfeldbacteria bacterium]|nr:hypothetical protein [Candidatus Kerfeldbacteria bacterium]